MMTLAVVRPGDAVEGLDVDSVRNTHGRLQSGTAGSA